jgi:hypothetical protein
MISRASSYLKKILANPAHTIFAENNCARISATGSFNALAELGEKRNEFLADIYAQHSQLDQVAQIKLARYLSQFPEWQKSHTPCLISCRKRFMKQDGMLQLAYPKVGVGLIQRQPLKLKLCACLWLKKLSQKC